MPFYVTGAEPGDALEVRFDRIWPNRDRAVASSSIAPHVLDPEYVREQPAASGPAVAEWQVDTAAVHTLLGYCVEAREA